MGDPLSVATSIVGLIAAAAQIIPQLYNLGTAIKDAPHLAQAAASELKDITIVLEALQKYIDGKAYAAHQRLSLITVEHITATLTGCVISYSDLDALLKSLRADTGLRAWDRAVWFVKKDQVNMLISRLQNHKMTFSLMLNIIQCASLSEAEKSMDSVCEIVNKVLQSNQQLSMRLRNMEDIYARRILPTTAPSVSMSKRHTNAGAEQETNVVLLNSASGSMRSISTISDTETIKPHDQCSKPPHDTELDLPLVSAFEFEELLNRSHVYRHVAASHSESSLVDDSRSTLAISICSSMTLGDVSRISVYALPVYATEISNPECYSFLRPAAVVEDNKCPSTSNVQRRDRQGQKRDPQSPAQMWKSFRKSPVQPDYLVKQAAARVFGVSLNVSIGYAHIGITLSHPGGLPQHYTNLPIIVATCGLFLAKRGNDTEHIFTISGSPKRIQELRIVFDSLPGYGNGFEWVGYTVFDAGSILLQYLLQLPDAVIPIYLHGRFCEPYTTYQAQDVHAIEAQGRSAADFDLHATITEYQRLILDLPLYRRQLLLFLLRLLAIFARKSDINKMTTRSLARIFQPGILKHSHHEYSLQEARSSQDVLVFLIENQDSFLSDTTSAPFLSDLSNR